MKKNKYIIILLLTLGFSACRQDVEWVTPTWAEAIYPAEGATVGIDFFQPDSVKVFTWRLKENASYKIHFDTDVSFPNPKTFDVGHVDALQFTNKDLIALLQELDPTFKSTKRFFWKVEESRNGETVSTWRYFNALMSVESFTDLRDGEKYRAEQFILEDGSLMTIMSENLRATVYADGTPLQVAARDVAFSPDEADFLENYPAFASEEFKKLAGKYYTWATAVNMTWAEAKTATLADEKIQGVCPQGWHLPSAKEMQVFRELIGLHNGANLKHPQYWRTTADITNSAKMNIVLSGVFETPTSPALNVGPSNPVPDNRRGGFWTSSPAIVGAAGGWNEYPLSTENTNAAGFYLMQDSHGTQVFWGLNKNYLAPCRCIMDND